MQNEQQAVRDLPRDSINNEDEIDLSELAAFIFNARKLIAMVAGGITAIALLYAVMATPIYNSDVLIQVEEKAAGGLGELTSMFSEKSPTSTEIEILKSRAVVGAAIDQLRLDIEVSPIHFPLFGQVIARSYSGEGVRAPVLGMSSYAWGGEVIQVDRLDVDNMLVEQPLMLVIGEAGTFTLLGPEDEELLTGQAGIAAERNGNGIYISRMEANAGTRFKLVKRYRFDMVNKLREKLSISEQGKGTGVIRMSMEHRDPKELTAMLSAIANAYLRQNVERRSQEAEQTLQFLDTQLPTLKASLDTAETQFNQYRANVGSIDLNMEAQALLDHYTDLEKRISGLELKRTELGEKFTASHPAVVSLNEQIRRLRGELATLDNQLRAMPEEQQESVRLSRDVKVANELYLLLLNKAQEMRVIKAGTTGNVRIIDQAYTPISPIKPKKTLIVIAGVILGVMAGIFAAFLRRAFNKGVDNPEVLEQRLGISSFASIMHSDLQEKKDRRKDKDDKPVQLLAFADPADLAIEAMRSLRTSLQFASLEAANNIISLTGPSPAIGKSFISANLSAVLADSGKRVLLVDADMRKGHLHDYFGLKRGLGLSGVISGDVKISEALVSINKHLDFLPAGIVPPNPAELLMSEQFVQLIRGLSEKYDSVIIDTPPILAVTDASIIGRYAGINFVVLRSGQHPMREIEVSIKRLRQNGVKINGFIFNDVPLKSHGYGSNYTYHYQYTYK
jgi:tyrosine-protein kinase Etk/Wzc